jgi:beta-glucosidase
VAIVVAADYYTEGADRSCLTLECPKFLGDQDGLIEAVAAANPRTAVVLESGGPDLTPWRDRVGAVLEAWYPGGPGGPAVADVLFGQADPGGRLPATFPATPSQIPDHGDAAAYPGTLNQVHYSEGVLVGYRWYDARGQRPAFPFGYGLSYTRFSYGGLRVVRSSARRVTVRVRVRNTGARAGAEVVQLYVGFPRRAGEPPKVLKAFRRVQLARGRGSSVRFTLDRHDLAVWDTPAHRWVSPTGRYRLMVGSSSRNIRAAASFRRRAS